MASDTAHDLKNTFFIDYEALYKKAEALSEEYKNASPFPNCFIDNFFEVSTYNNAVKTFPDPDSELWKTPENIHTKGKSVTKQGSLGL